MDEMIKWIIGFLALVLIVAGVYLLRDKLAGLFESLKQVLTFRR